MAILITSIVTLIFGFILMWILAWLTATPVRVVWAALKRVEDGDLSSDLVVFDGTELGELQRGFNSMVKGLRAISDFEWEFQMHHLNRNLAPEVETMYLMSSPQYSFLSSSGVKEVASFGGNVDDLVPEPVARRFRELFPQGKPGAPVSPQE